MTSCVSVVNRILKNRTIDEDLEDDNDYSFNIVVMLTMGFVFYAIKQIKFIPITIIGYSAYSHLVAWTLELYNIPYIFIKDSNQIVYYEVEGKEIPFEGRSFNYWKCKVEQDMFVPLTELDELAEHCDLTELDRVQQMILDRFPKFNLDQFYEQEFNYETGSFEVKRFSKDIYHVITDNSSWFTKLIISDDCTAFKPGDIIKGLNFDETNFSFEDNYEVISNEEIICLKDNENKFFSLKDHKPFVSDGLHIIHPFHLPSQVDIVLTIMIVTLGLVRKNFKQYDMVPEVNFNLQLF